MRVALVVVGDGRYDYLRRTVDVATKNLPFFGDMDRIMVNDSGNTAYRIHLEREFPEFDIVSHADRRGMAGAVQSGWETALRKSKAEFVFHLEEDFVLTHRVPLEAMRALLLSQPKLSQVVLRRQPWNPHEIHQGDIFGDDERYVQWPMWVAHDVIFSLNPCLIPRRVIEMGWPSGNEAEMTEKVKRAGLTMAFWGKKDATPDVEHIGHLRGTGWKL